MGFSNVVMEDVSADELVADRAANLYGFAIRETAGAAAVVRIRNGVDATGVPFIPISFAANESVGENYLPNGVRFPNGIFFDVVSGAVEGSILYSGG